MKLIRCANCGAKHMGPKTEKHPNGAPVLMGVWMGSSQPLVLKCHRCTNSMRLGAVAFNLLPSLSSEELTGLGFPAQPAVQ